MASRFSDDDLRAIARGLVPAVKEAIARELAPVLARLDRLESRPDLKYQGVWQHSVSYSAGALVTRSGGLWLAQRDTAAQPGSDDCGWRLIVKSGRAAAVDDDA